jgi:hypothetical protein
MKRLLILVCVCLMFVGMGTAKGQDKRTDSNDQLVERKYDRFKDETIVKLKPQRIIDIKSPRQVLDMSAEATFKGERPTQWNEMIHIMFVSSAEKSPYRDPIELNFIVDGERVKGAPAVVGKPYNPTTPVATDLKVAENVNAFISLNALRKITSGKKVEMKLGSTELTLNAETLSNLRRFSSDVFTK